MIDSKVIRKQTYLSINTFSSHHWSVSVKRKVKKFQCFSLKGRIFKIVKGNCNYTINLLKKILNLYFGAPIIINYK